MQESSELIRQIAEYAKENKITHAEIAACMGWKPNNVSRLLSGKQSPTLPTFFKLIEAIDKDKLERTYLFLSDTLFK